MLLQRTLGKLGWLGSKPIRMGLAVVNLKADCKS